MISRMGQAGPVADPHLGLLAGETRPRLLTSLGDLGQGTTPLSPHVCSGDPLGKTVGTSAGRGLACGRCSINEHFTG